MPSYSARLRVTRCGGKDLRARTPVLLAFRRPGRPADRGPGAQRRARDRGRARGPAVGGLPLASARVYSGAAQPTDMESLLGVALAPAEVMDLLTGVACPRLLSYRARWGAALPRQIEATLPDGARLKATVEDARGAGAALGPARLHRAAARRLPDGRRSTRRARSGAAADGGLAAAARPLLREGEPRARGPGHARRRLSRAAHDLPDDRPLRRHRPAAARRRRHRRAATIPACPSTRRTSPSAPRATSSASPGVTRRGRDRHHQAHPGGRRPRRRQLATPPPSSWASTGSGGWASGPAGLHPAGPPDRGRRALLPGRRNGPRAGPGRRGLSPLQAGRGARSSWSTRSGPFRRRPCSAGWTGV